MVYINYKIMIKLFSMLPDLGIDPISLVMFRKIPNMELLLPYGCKLSKSQFRGRSKYAIKFYSYDSSDYLNLRIRFKFLPELPYWYKKYQYNQAMVF